MGPPPRSCPNPFFSVPRAGSHGLERVEGRVPDVPDDDVPEHVLPRTPRLPGSGRPRAIPGRMGSPGASAWYELWVDALDSLRGKVARVLGARREEVALAPSVSVALSAVASALDYAERPRVVLSDLEFPTLSYQWAVKPVAERVFVPSKDGIHVSPDLFESAADDRTALVATSHVYYTSGAVQDIRAIAKVAHGHGALALIDAYQATGQLPTDV